MSREEPQHKLRLDGLNLTDQVHHDLNKMFARTFSSPQGRALLNYLRALSTQRSLLPGNVTSDQALHHAGACWLMNVIDGRITQGYGKIVEEENGPEQQPEQPDGFDANAGIPGGPEQPH